MSRALRAAATICQHTSESLNDKWVQDGANFDDDYYDENIERLDRQMTSRATPGQTVE